MAKRSRSPASCDSPQCVAARLPAVILQHGSAGSNARDEFWAKTFNEMGIASFLVDSFSGRGLTRVSSNRALLGPYDLVVDAYRAFDVLANHPRIDPARIAIMGFSLGGISALYSSLKRFQQMWNPRAAFAAHIPLYAGCATRLIGDTDVSAAPIRQFHGAADDYTPVALCRAYFERLRAAGRDVLLTEYPGAHHSYDNPLGNKTPSVSKGAQSFRACKLKEEPLGTIINAESVQGPLHADRCSHRLQRGGGECDTYSGKRFRADGVQARTLKPSGKEQLPNPFRSSKNTSSADTFTLALRSMRNCCRSPSKSWASSPGSMARISITESVSAARSISSNKAISAAITEYALLFRLTHLSESSIPRDNAMRCEV